MPKGFTEHEKKLIGERLLEQGYRLFTAYGLKKTNVEELAQAAGISKGAFYLFYESKEALFMDVVEQAERLFRQELLAVVDLPGPSPRARLYALLKRAFTLFKTIPILTFFTSSDYQLLFSRVPAEKFQQHMASDGQFIRELVARCRAAGIPIQVQAEELSGLLYALLFVILHEGDFDPNNASRTFDVLLELVAAFCLGEITLEAFHTSSLMPRPEERA
jgi:AcrR family transcriptional regulator